MKIYQGRKFYLYGIKGAGMSALAIILADLGAEVSGCDVEKHYFTEDALCAKGIKIHSFDDFQIDVDATAIIGNAFWNKPQTESIKNKIKYIDFIARMESDVQAIGIKTVAIAGTHGKTTTTKMLVDSIDNAIGLIGDGTGIVKGEPTLFVYEACEYQGHFANYKPDFGIILNIEFDHPDYFEDLNHVIRDFQSFADNCKELYINDEDKNCLYIRHAEKHPYTTRGIEDLPFKGKYMNQNFQAIKPIIAMAGHNPNVAIQKFESPKRRFTTYNVKGYVVIDDYAHHPTEIAKTFDRMVSEFPGREKIVVFQPHTYSRTQELLNEFAESLSDFDKVYIMDIFGSAREEKGSITSDDLIKLIPNARAWDLNSLVIGHKSADAVILLCGAGDINELILDDVIKGLERN